MTEFDVIVIGGGTGNNVAAAAADAGVVDVIDESCTCPDWQQRSQ
ncbi:hypothetical protein ABNG03_04745 [Halorubrum sp. RMP-47]|uniref:FAD-dependent oxidoreductase 2 FAD binding domain-containing protein n=1 Tax=Halorubrum miltondacostae TaxID=3076378 RepID=A0ABD5M5I0_9EURY